MEVSVRAVRHVIVNDDVDSFNVNTSAEDVSGHHNSLLEVLEDFIAFNSNKKKDEFELIKKSKLPVLLTEVSVNGNGREVALIEEEVELFAAGDVLDEDDDLVELEHVKDVVEFLVLLIFLEGDIVLLEAFEGEFVLVIDKNFEGLVHELTADLTDVLRQGGGEHHDLFLKRSALENLLHVTSHI